MASSGASNATTRLRPGFFKQLLSRLSSGRNDAACSQHTPLAWFAGCQGEARLWTRRTNPLKARHTIFLDLSGRAKFRITGADRLRFLNGQITNDLRKASETSAIEACILNAKGKTDAHIYISASGSSFLVDAAADLRETLKVRLERYVIADDVQIEDVTDQFSLFHVLSQQSPALEHGGLSLCAVLLNRDGTYGAMLRSSTSRYRNYPRDGPLAIPTRLRSCESSREFRAGVAS